MSEHTGLDKFTEYTVMILFGIVIGIILGLGWGSEEKRPIEGIVKADSLIKVNDSIKLKVEQIDSIKNAKVIEVQSLDNDSTVKLFYELISK